MRVDIARAHGFCDGVERAIRIAMDAAAKHGGLRADGPLVHNRTACDLLARHGIGDGQSVSPAATQPVLIRAHGIPPEERRKLLADGRELVDATCVHVARNQRLAAEAGARGDLVLIAGDADHAEVKAVAGCAGPACRVAASPDDIEALDTNRRVFLLAQTTFNIDMFSRMADTLLRLRPDSRVARTICRATHERQEEAKRLARRTEAVVVVGGRHSANTGRLADAVRAEGKPAFAVETAAELRAEDFARFRSVGVTSGASTPGWITQDVVNRLRSMGRRTPADRARALLAPFTESRAAAVLSAAGLALAAGRFLLGGPLSALAAAGAGVFVVLVYFGGRLIRDLHDIAGDRLMGRETLPAGFGAGAGRRLAGTALTVAACLAVAACLGHIYGGGAFGGRFVFLALMPLVPGVGLFLLEAMREGDVRDAVAVEAGVAGTGMLAGVLAVLA